MAKCYCHMAASCIYHLPTFISQEPYIKAYPLRKNVGEFYGEKSGEWTVSKKKNDQTDRARLCRKQERRYEMGLNDSPEIPDRRGHQTLGTKHM